MEPQASEIIFLPKKVNSRVLYLYPLLEQMIPFLLCRIDARVKCRACLSHNFLLLDEKQTKTQHSVLANLFFEMSHLCVLAQEHVLPFLPMLIHLWEEQTCLRLRYIPYIPNPS